jgi:hypothetical protein
LPFSDFAERVVWIGVGDKAKRMEARADDEQDRPRTATELEPISGSQVPPTFLILGLQAAMKLLVMDDEVLWAAFRDRSLPATQWTHREHLRIAWMHLAHWSLDEAHSRMRVGIIRLNTAHGLEETMTRGYHETLTRVWLVLVGAARAENRAPDSAVFLSRNADRLGKDVPLRHYRREHLFSPTARSIFVPPDLEPLPWV